MKLALLKERIQKAEKDGRYLEAFMLLSGITESIVVLLATAIEASKQGFDGKNTSFAEAVQKDKKTENFSK